MFFVTFVVYITYLFIAQINIQYILYCVLHAISRATLSPLGTGSFTPTLSLLGTGLFSQTPVYNISSVTQLVEQ